VEAGLVFVSNRLMRKKASSRLVPQTSSEGWKLEHTLGLSGLPKSLQRLASDRWGHLTPAGLPSGMPGMDEEMEIAVQQAPQFERQSIGPLFILFGS